MIKWWFFFQQHDWYLHCSLHCSCLKVVNNSTKYKRIDLRTCFAGNHDFYLPMQGVPVKCPIGLSKKGILKNRKRHSLVVTVCLPAGLDGTYVNPNPYCRIKICQNRVPHPQHHWVACKSVTLSPWDMRCLAALSFFCDGVNPSKTDRYPLRFQKIS